MKNNYLLIITLFSELLCFAQPVLNYSPSYSIISHSVANDEGVFLDNEGPNQIWDCSAFTISSLTGNLSPISVSNAPGHEQFPSANFCQKYTSLSFATPIEEYNFYRITANEWEVLGKTNGDGVVILQYVDTREWPMQLEYQDTYSNIYQTITDLSPSSSTIVYDAYGTLTTPYGIYENVVRTKTVYPNITSYEWTQVIPEYLPLMQKISSTQFGTQVTLYENSPELGIAQMLIEKKIIAYPNPTKSYINLKLPNNENAERISVLDSRGKKVLEAFENTNRLNVENLQVGIYFVKVFSKDKYYVSKFIKQ